MKRRHLTLLVTAPLLLSISACSDDHVVAGEPAGVTAVATQAALERCADNGTGHHGHDPNKQLFWGELHLHTAYSLDAYSFATRTWPSDAYLFAKGLGDVDIATGTDEPHGPTISQPRPLDFTAITDHSEFLSVIAGCVVNEDSGYYDDPACESVRSTVPGVQQEIFPNMAKILLDLCARATDRDACVAQQRSAWVDMQLAAARAYRPCRFTSFVAYEWSDQPLVEPKPGYDPPGPLDLVPATNHRNVIFANANVPDVPFSSLFFPGPPALWNALDQHCTGTCDAVTIPHNTNMSAGVSLRVWDPSTRGVRLQTRYQVAAEIYQHKGASECYYDPASVYSDADCQFEQIQPTKEKMPIGESSFLRSGLSRGLAAQLERADGVNPLKLGFVGSTDGHNAAPGNVDEASWQGHSGRLDDSPKRRLEDRWDWGPGGITGVWAEENTRHSIFSAIKRRETYATSGPRIRTRVFQTADIGACSDPNYPASILPRANPMGSTFKRRHLRGAAAPTFVIEAWPDPYHQERATDVRGVARLAAVQVIKIRATPVVGGPPLVTTEPPYRVTLSEGFDPRGGCMTWTDPSFDANEAALYYVRVLQEPTWRWTHHDCRALRTSHPQEWLDVGCGPGGAIPKDPVQERAWTSPIWFEP